MIFVTYCLAGVFALNQKKEVLEFSLFPKEADKIVERIDKLKKGEMVGELKDVLDKTEDRDIVTDIDFKKEGFNVEFREKISASEHLRQNMRKIAVDTGFVKSPGELNRIISEIQVLKTRKKIKSEGKKDKVAMQAVSCVEDLVDISNRLSERLHEWYGHYYPELEDAIKDNERYVEAISEDPRRERFKKFDSTIGIDLNEDDLAIIQKLSEKTKGLFELKSEIESYLEVLMPKVAVNITSIAGPNLAAKLVLLAGGMKNLSRLPSSTIQLMGAEKALFRFMKNKKKNEPPKYGILFLHPKVMNSPQELKGKVARAVASELSMAAKTDFYTKEDKTEYYKKRLEKRLKEIFKK